MIDINKSNRTRHDVYLLFKRKEDITAFLANENTPEYGRFRAEDYIDFNTGYIEHNNTSHVNLKKLTIITGATFDFKDNDYVYDVKYRITWRIAPGGVGVADDGQMKEFSLRPRKDSILTLIR